MVRTGEIEHGRKIAHDAERVWNWSSPAGQRRARRRASLIAIAARLGPDDDVLELGCGTGLFSESFAATGCRLTAIDVAPALLEIANSRRNAIHAPKPRNQITFRLDDAESMSFHDASFDAVVGSSVLHHLNIDAALNEIRRVLRSGGRVAFAEPNMINPQIALQRSIPALGEWAGESPEETAFVRWRLVGQLKQAGFRSVRVQPFDFLHPTTPRPLIGLVRGMGRAMERLPLVREIAGSLLISAETSS